MTMKSTAAWAIVAALLAATPAMAQVYGPTPDGGGGGDDTTMDDTTGGDANATDDTAADTTFRASATLTAACLETEGGDDDVTDGGANDTTDGTDANATDDGAGDATATDCMSPSEISIPEGTTVLVLNLTNSASAAITVAWNASAAGDMPDAANDTDDGATNATARGNVTVEAGESVAVMISTENDVVLTLGEGGREIGRVSEETDDTGEEATEDDRTPMPGVVLVIGATALVALAYAYRKRK